MMLHVAVALISVVLCRIVSSDLCLINVAVLVACSYIFVYALTAFVNHMNKGSKVLLVDRPVDASAVPRTEHDRKRHATYPFNGRHANTWYTLCDVKDLDNGCVSFNT